MKDLQSGERVVANLPDHMRWFWLLAAIIRSFADAVELVAAFQIKSRAALVEFMVDCCTEGSTPSTPRPENISISRQADQHAHGAGA
jgi:hypothetical protein